MTGPDYRPTPPGGTEIPDEELPTSPDLRSVVEQTCPECAGDGGFLVTYWEGQEHHGVHTRCPTCNGHKRITRAAFLAWHQRRRGRPQTE